MTEEVNEEVQMDISDQLAAAWDAHEEAEDGEVLESTDEPPETAWESDEHDAEVQPEGELSGVRSEPKQNAKLEGGESPSLDAPPKGLDAAAREAWKEAPEAIKQHIAKFESRMDGLAQKYGESYQRVQAMDQVLAPYQQMFQVNGGAQTTIKNLLQTGAVLQMGTPAQKAEITANIIKQFGIDVKALDNMLVGKGAPKHMAEQERLNQLMQQHVAPLKQQLSVYQQREQQAQQAQAQKLQTDLQQFESTHEFYNDVRNEMADLMDMAANRGRNMTLDEAYDIACSTHPTISKIIQGRTAQQSGERRRRAASSISGSPAGDGSGIAADSRLAALNAAWDNAGRM